MTEKQGWFDLPGRPGDRTLAQQLMSLDWVLDNVAGRTVLDVGCAEGLISIEMAKRGAIAVHGVEIVEKHLPIARELAGDLPVTFEAADCNTWSPKRAYDVVLLLSILHKFKNPSERAAVFAECCADILVFRTPPKFAPTIVDWRSNNERHQIGDVFRDAGFKLLRGKHDGPFGEWVGIYQRA